MWAEGTDLMLKWQDFPGDRFGSMMIFAHERQWPISPNTRHRLALAHEPQASASPDGYRLATCVMPNCKRLMVAMWHLWLDAAGIKKEIHMCAQCATDYFGAPEQGFPDYRMGDVIVHA